MTEPAAPPLPDIAPEPAPTSGRPPLPPYATGWQRSGASVLDIVLFYIFYTMIDMMMGRTALAFGIYMTLATLYYLVTEGSGGYATLGKKLMGLSVGTTTGAPLTFGGNVWRVFLYYLPSIPFIVVMLMPQTQAFLEVMREEDQAKLAARFVEPDFLRQWLVFCAAYFGFVIVSLLLMALPIFFTKEKVGLHDWLSGTRVYQRDAKPGT